MNVNCNPVTKASNTNSQNQITLTPTVSITYNSATDVFTAKVKVKVDWTIGSLDGTEKVTVEVCDNGANVIGTSGEYTLRNNNPKTSEVTFTAPTSGLVYIRVILVWNSSTTLYATSDYANIAPPRVTNISFGNIDSTTATMTASANYNCNKWEYKIGSGSWTQIATSDTTQLITLLTGLSAGSANTVQVRATRSDIGRTGNATTASVTTLGKATINEISRVQLDVDAPSVDIDCTIYDTSYTYELTVYYGETVFILDMPLTFTSKGRQTKTIDLTALKSDILGEMPAVASLTITYALNTTIGSNIYQDIADGEVYVTEENSAPVWAATPSITAFDEATQEFFGGNTDIHNGVINNVTEYRGYCAGGAITRNGAIAIDHYYIVVGGNTITANVAQITSRAVDFAGSTTTIVFGAVDSRGFKVEYSVTDIPIWRYTPMYWQQTNIARANGYDNKITFAIRAKYDPLEATVGGVTYANAPSTSITMRYSTDNGTIWNTITLVGTNNTTDNTVDYSASALTTPLDIDNTKNVLIELTANDLLSTASLTMTVPNGVPLIRFEDGKITINGDVEINGNLVVNGTITQNTPSTDLTGTTWQFVNDYNEWSEYPFQEFSYAINFTSNGNNYTLLSPDASTGGYALLYDTTTVYRPSGGPPAWVNQNYRTIAITGGADTGSTALREWLEANATQIS